MSHRRTLLVVPFIVLCLGAVALSLTGSRKAQNLKAANLAANRESSVGISTSVETKHHSVLMSPLDIQSMTRDADFIAIGRVGLIRDGGGVLMPIEGQAAEVKRMIASLQINRVIKGEPDTTAVSFEFLISPTRPDFREIEPSQFGMFFLRKNKNGSYAVLNSFYPFVIASSSAKVSDGNHLDQVVSVIGDVLREPKSKVEERRFAVTILASARTDLSTKILRQAIRDADDVVRLQAIAALLNRNDRFALDVASNILLHPAAVEEYLLNNLSAALEGVRDTQAIPTLKLLLSSANPRTRKGAAVALRQMHVAEGVAALVPALDDVNWEIRYQAVIGLGEFTGEDPWSPAITEFQRDEQRYLTHWKEWARNR